MQKNTYTTLSLVVAGLFYVSMNAMNPEPFAPWYLEIQQTMEQEFSTVNQDEEIEKLNVAIKKELAESIAFLNFGFDPNSDDSALSQEE